MDLLESPGVVELEGVTEQRKTVPKVALFDPTNVLWMPSPSSLVPKSVFGDFLGAPPQSTGHTEFAWWIYLSFSFVQLVHGHFLLNPRCLHRI